VAEYGAFEDKCTLRFCACNHPRQERFGSVLVTFLVTQNLVLIVEMSILGRKECAALKHLDSFTQTARVGAEGRQFRRVKTLKRSVS
jgi:hypothetical protein